MCPCAPKRGRPDLLCDKHPQNPFGSLTGEAEAKTDGPAQAAHSTQHPAPAGRLLHVLSRGFAAQLVALWLFTSWLCAATVLLSTAPACWAAVTLGLLPPFGCLINDLQPLRSHHPDLFGDAFLGLSPSGQSENQDHSRADVTKSLCQQKKSSMLWLKASTSQQ